MSWFGISIDRWIRMLKHRFGAIDLRYFQSCSSFSTALRFCLGDFGGSFSPNNSSANKRSRLATWPNKTNVRDWTKQKLYQHKCNMFVINHLLNVVLRVIQAEKMNGFNRLFFQALEGPNGLQQKPPMLSPLVPTHAPDGPPPASLWFDP